MGLGSGSRLTAAHSALPIHTLLDSGRALRCVLRTREIRRAVSINQITYDCQLAWNVNPRLESGGRAYKCKVVKSSPWTTTSRLPYRTNPHYVPPINNIIPPVYASILASPLPVYDIENARLFRCPCPNNTIHVVYPTRQRAS